MEMAKSLVARIVQLPFPDSVIAYANPGFHTKSLFKYVFAYPITLGQSENKFMVMQNVVARLDVM